MSTFASMILLNDVLRWAEIDTSYEHRFIGQIDFIYQYRKGRKLMEPYIPVLMNILDPPPPRQGPKQCFRSGVLYADFRLDKMPMGEVFRGGTEQAKAVLNMSDAVYYNRRRRMKLTQKWGDCFLERISRACNHHDP